MKNKKKVVNLHKVAGHLSESQMSSVSGGGLFGSMKDYLTAVGHIFGAIAELYDGVSNNMPGDPYYDPSQAQCAE